MRESWEELYQLAATETDCDRMPERIAVARQALEARLHELALGADYLAERHRIAAALTALRTLEKESHGWKPWREAHLRQYQ
jgi:hypothetical protein